VELSQAGPVEASTRLPASSIYLLCAIENVPSCHAARPTG
jgi:hypothetical protein